jgi:hypothetical protein
MGCNFMHFHHFLFMGYLLGSKIIPFLKFWQIHTCFFSQSFQTFPKIQAVYTTIKIKNIACSLTAKTIIRSFIRINRKRRLCFLMKRAWSNKPAAHRTQFHIASCQIHHAQFRFNFSNSITGSSCHFLSF